MDKKFTFTRARLEKLPPAPAGKRIFVYDASEPGMCLMTTGTGNKSFYLYRKVDGKPEKMLLGNFPEITIDQAREAARIKKGEIANGKNPAEERRILRGEQTLSEVFTRFINEWGKPRKRTWQADQDQFDRHCTGIKSRRLSSIKLQDIQRLHTSIGTKAPYAANRVLAMLSSVFNFARTIGYTGDNPCRGVRRFKETSRRRFVRPDEMPRFLEALDKYEDQALADFFKLALYTGARRSNVQSASWSDVNFSRKIWTIPAEASKSKQKIEIHLTPESMEVLQRRWALRVEGNPYVFPSRSKSRHLQEPKFAWKCILESAGITDLRLHDLRRTFGSFLTANGTPAAIVAEALGQTTQHVTHVYTRVDLSSVVSAANVATAAMARFGIPKKTRNSQKVG
jgi:integrase